MALGVSSSVLVPLPDTFAAVGVPLPSIVMVTVTSLE